jgi:hypothetical protein
MQKSSWYLVVSSWWPNAWAMASLKHTFHQLQITNYQLPVANYSVATVLSVHPVHFVANLIHAQEI